MDSKVNQKIKENINKIKIIDTHEHLFQERERLSRVPDLFETFLVHYASSDLISSGMSQVELQQVRDIKLPLSERWKIFEPFWDNIQNTGYAKALNIAARDLYEISERLTKIHILNWHQEWEKRIRQACINGY